MMTMLRYAAPIPVRGQQGGARTNRGGREAGEEMMGGREN